MNGCSSPDGRKAAELLQQWNFLEICPLGFCGTEKQWVDSESHSVVSISLWPPGLYSTWKSPGQNTGVDSLSLLQRIVPTQGSNPGLPHCRWILYQLSHRGRPVIVEWVACPFSCGSSQSRDWTRIYFIEGEFFTNWAIRKAQDLDACHIKGILLWNAKMKSWSLDAAYCICGNWVLQKLPRSRSRMLEKSLSPTESTC